MPRFLENHQLLKLLRFIRYLHLGFLLGRFYEVVFTKLLCVLYFFLEICILLDFILLDFWYCLLFFKSLLGFNFGNNSWFVLATGFSDFVIFKNLFQLIVNFFCCFSWLWSCFSWLWSCFSTIMNPRLNFGTWWGSFFSYFSSEVLGRVYKSFDICRI